MLIFTSFIFLISFLGLNFLLHKKTNLSFALTPFIAIVSIISTLYIFGIFELLLVGAWGVYIIGFGSFFYYVYIKFKEKKITINYFFNSSFYPLYFFVFLFFINLFLYKDFQITGFDSKAHWGVFTKIITTYHSLIDEYTMINKADYPRISSLLHYYIVLFLNKGVFKEGIVIFSHTLFFISALCFFIFHKKQKIIISILIFIAFYILFGIVEFLSISHIYNDATLALFWGLSIILYLSNRKKNLWVVGAIMFCLPQIKEIGLLYCCFTLFIIAINELFYKKELFKPRLKKLGILIGVVIISKLSWFLYLQHKGVDVNSFELGKKIEYAQKHKDYALKSYFKSIVFFGNFYSKSNNNEKYIIKKLVNPSPYSDRVAGIIKKISGKESAFYHFLKTKTNYIIIGPIYFILMIISYLFLLNFQKYSYIYKTISIHKNKQFIYFCIGLSLILISYIFIQLFLYLNTSFVTLEILKLVSFDRYLGTIIIGGILIILYLLSIVSKKKLILILILILFPFFRIKKEFLAKKTFENTLPNSTITGNYSSSYIDCSTNNYPIDSNIDIIYQECIEDSSIAISKMMDEIKKIDKKAVVFIYVGAGNGYIKKEYLYNGFPLRIIAAPYFVTIQDTEHRRKYHDPWRVAITTPNEFKQMLEKCDYLLVRNDGYHFWKNYGQAVKEAELKGVLISNTN